MTTVFPGAVDSLPRPAANTKRNAGSGLNLSTVIDNLSDAIEAIEAAALVGQETSVASLLINGNFDHWQQATTSTPTTTYSVTTSYAADQAFVRPSGATLGSAGRSTTVPDTKSLYSLAVVGAASVTTVDIGQRIRSAIVSTRARQSLVYAAYVRNESGAAFTPNLRIGTPAAADDFTTVTNRLDQALQSCPDSAWTRVYHVFDASAYTNIANGMEVCLRVPSGSLVSGDTVRIAQMDLRPGMALAAYIPPDPDLELLRCLQYYELLGGETTHNQFGPGYATASTTFTAVARWKGPKWKIPAIGYVAASGYAFTDPTTAAVALTSGPSSFHITRYGMTVTGTVASGLTNTLPGQFIANNSTSTTIAVNARL